MEKIVEKSNEARSIQSSCKRLIEENTNILKEVDFTLTYLNIVSVEDVSDFNYEKG